MTRENKVALVVGFALVLLVGVLISDYFSKAQTQRSADLLQAEDPGDGGRRERLGAGELPEPRQAALTDLQRPRETPVIRPQLGPPNDDPDNDPTAEPVLRQVNLAAPVTRPALPAPEAPTQRTHTVRSGESLSEICVQYYGDVSLTEKLAKANGLDDPNRVRAGQKLVVPAATVLAGGPVQRPMPMPAPETDPQDDANYRTYTVRPGDSLSGLAARFLDSAADWRQLYELNRAVISDPDRVPSGITIRVPS